MEIQIRIDGADGLDELLELSQWLGDEDELRGRVRVVESVPSPTELGGLPEFVSVMVEGGTGAVLASSLKTWLLMRRKIIKATIIDGERTITIDLASTQDVTSELGQLLEAAKKDV